MKSRPKAQQAAAPPPVPRRKWLFPIAALLLIPVLALSGLEVALRLAGYGYPTSLFQKTQFQGRDYLTDNENFSLRFFPPELTRRPGPFGIESVKPAGTCRIFIFGESAALGDPEPSFGAGRYLEVLLRDHFPGANFEVVNLGITAISSHVIVPIARECADHQGDLWIVYMGNNEMIGPFGAATVFGAKAPPWPMVRLALALQKTRVGQLLVALERKLNGRGSGPGEWSGLRMFMRNQLAPDDPRKEVVYKNFHRNLLDILRAGRRAGAAILLNTVAVNLKDCPPFASFNSSRLAPADREQFERWCVDGRGAEISNNWTLGAADFGRALALDPQMAEAQFREGQCLLQLHHAAEAAPHFQKACDCDGLVFRADSRINDIIRETARQLQEPELVLCDAAASLPETGAIAGEETFYEHVHLNFDGNYRLARLWADQAERLLPADVKSKSNGAWASQEACEARLGLTDWNRGNVLHSVWERTQDPPLSTQFNNEQRAAALTARLDVLFARRDAAAAAAARALYTDAIARAPRYYMLHHIYADFLELTGDLKDATLEWKQAHELVPRNPFAFLSEGRLLERQGQFAAAGESLRQAVTLPPRYPDAWLELGKLAAAEGKLEKALENYRRSAALDPNNPQIHLHMGKALSLLKRSDESMESFQRALQLDAANWEAHYALGGELGMHGRVAEAKEQFREVVRLQPQYAMGHLNLGVALFKLNDPESACREFAETLRLDPTNQSARAYLAAAAKPRS